MLADLLRELRDIATISRRSCVATSTRRSHCRLWNSSARSIPADARSSTWHAARPVIRTGRAGRGIFPAGCGV